MSVLSGCGGGGQAEEAPARIAVAVPALQTAAADTTREAGGQDEEATATSAAAPPAPATADGASPQSPFPASVIVRYHSTSVATVGQTFEVVLDFSQVSSRGAKVQISGDAKLVLAGAKPFKLKEGDTVFTFHATAVAPGRSLIYVYARQGTGASAIAIPIEIEPA